MVKDIHKVGEEETRKVVEVDEMLTQANVRWSQKRNSPIKMIGLNVMPSQGQSEAESSDAMITCTILIRDRMTNVLFDLSSDYSYVSFKFALVFYMIFDVLDAPI